MTYGLPVGRLYVAVPLTGCTPYTFSNMTVISTANSSDLAAPVDQATSLIAELVSEQQSDVDMMIGIGLVKDSDAVFFQYVGDKEIQALMLPTGKPLARLQNVKLTGITIAEDIGEFNSTKINLYLTTNQGRTVMLTSGLTTIWTQCVLTGLIGAFESGNIEFALTLDSWKGTSKMRPCFAAVRSGQLKQTSQTMYDSLLDARSDRDYKKTEAICRDAVAVLAQAVGLEAPVPTDIQVEQETEF